jgi:hypothetical protein
VSLLNKEAGSIASDIEREIRRVLGPQFSVQAEISFATGSIIIEGTVLLLCWTGTAALEGLKREIAELVRVPVKRLLVEVLGDLGVDASGLEISASVRGTSPARSTAQPAVRVAEPETILRIPSWMSVALIVAAAGIVILVLDRLLSVWPVHGH